MNIWEWATLFTFALIGYGAYSVWLYFRNKSLSAGNIVALLLLLLVVLVLLFFGIRQAGIHTERANAVAIVVAFSIGAICSFFVFDLLGGSVVGSSPVLTGRRWLNWVVMVLLMVKTGEILMGSMRGYVNTLRISVESILVLIVLALVSFSLGMLWAFIKSKSKSNSNSASNKKPWWIAGVAITLLIVFSARSTPDDYPSCILKEMPGTENNMVASAKAKECAQRFPLETDGSLPAQTEDSDACVVKYASSTGNERAAYFIASACRIKYGIQ